MIERHQTFRLYSRGATRGTSRISDACAQMASRIDVKEPAPVGPEPMGSEPEGDRGWRDRQPGSMGMMEWKSWSASSRTAFLGGQERQAQSTAAGVVRLLDGGLRPIPTTRPHPGPPITRTCVRRVHGTVPAPTLRRLASAPLSEAGLMQRYSSARSICQEQSKNIVSGTPRPSSPGLSR